MLRVLSGARSVATGGRRWILVVAVLVLSASLASASYAHGNNNNNPPHKGPGSGHDGGSGSDENNVITLDPGESIKLSSLVGYKGLALQIGDKLFDDFSFKLKNCDRWFPDDAKSSCITLTALRSGDSAFGISLKGLSPSKGNRSLNLILGYSVSVTDPNFLISDLHLSSSNSVTGKGFVSIIEKAYTGSSLNTQIAQLEVFNSNGSTPDFSDSVDLTQPLSKLFVKDEISLGGGGLSCKNRANIYSIDNVFSQTQIPEPSTYALIIAGLALLLLVGRRRFN